MSSQVLGHRVAHLKLDQLSAPLQHFSQCCFSVSVFQHFSISALHSVSALFSISALLSTCFLQHMLRAAGGLASAIGSLLVSTALDYGVFSQVMSHEKSPPATGEDQLPSIN